MEIKDIAKFRTYWKDKEGFKGFDENFIGSSHNGVNGFYRIVNGTVHDIKADLTPKLQNAQDEQAIYEFLQNAADSNSTNCAVIYDEDYFMVINNGQPFSVMDVEAILNSFQGTKADKSQKQNCGKIGRYGIGFKLVHRLVGKSDGAKELIENLDGPVIFSWFKKSQFNEFHSSKKDLDFQHDSELEKNNSPWLFKISLTCFPTMPNELVRNLNYKDVIIYGYDELRLLRNFLQKHLLKIQKLNLDSGSLFFLKFGQNKHKKLEESLRNINSGIGYSLNTLKTLDKVILQDSIVTQIPIERIDIKIDPIKDKVAFEKIDPEFPECPIEIMFGYRSDEYETLRSAPNIYQYFPMRNESHGLAFLIHASSFAKVTDRTKLDDQGESNIHTFQFLSEKIKELLKSDYQINQRKKARKIFKAIIFSEISQRQNSQLVIKGFLLPLIEYFKKNVPCKNGKFLSSKNVLIQRTKLNINPTDFGIDKQWFYWDIEDEKELIKEARDAQKLDLKICNIATLIEHAEVKKVNEWILNTAEEEVDLFIKEIERHIPKYNLFDLQFLECSNGNFYSINEIAEWDSSVVCLFDKIYKVAGILNSIGLITTKINISLFENLRNEASKIINYLNVINENKFFEEFIKSFTKHNTLSNIEKKTLFLSVKELHDVGDKALKEWQLFKNCDNKIQPLGELIASTIKVEPWLNKYQLCKEEYFKELDNYLVKQESVYPSIIYTNWDNIIDENEFSETYIENFCSEIVKYYDEAKQIGKELSKYRYIFCEGEFLESTEVFYNSEFLSIKDYQNLAAAIQNITGFKTPSQKILQYLSRSPFKTNNDTLIDHLNDTDLTSNEAYVLLQYCVSSQTKIFTIATFVENDEIITLKTDSNTIQYYSTDKELIEFISKHLPDTFIQLPKYLEDFKSLDGVVRNHELYERIISEIEDINKIAEEFLPLLKHKEIIKSFISELKEIRFNSSIQLTKDHFEYLIVTNIIQHFDEDEFEEIKDKFLIESKALNFKLSEITSSNDIRFDIDNKIYTLKISEILPDSDNYTKSEILETLLTKFKKLELPKTKIDNLFSINIEEDDLIEKIAYDLNNAIEDNTLVTSEQVAFALLYELKYGWSDFEEFKIYAFNEINYSLKAIWYVNDFTFIDKTAQVSKRYKGISKLLKLDDNHSIFKVSTDCTFLFKPTFDEEGKLICDYIEEELNDETCIELFDFLFKEYNKKGKDSKRDFEAVEGWSNLGNTETKKIIGFEPKTTILYSDTDFLIPLEQPLDWVIKWANTNDKKIFLEVLGIHSYDSDVIKLRKSLLEEDLISEDEIRNSDTLNKQLLENTLEWLCDSSLWENKCIDEPGKVVLLNSIIETLEWDENDYWTLDNDKLKEECEEWDDTNYDNWRENEDSFEIFLFIGQIPYKFVYNDAILAVKGDGDYWFDEDDYIFYCNSHKSTLLLLQMAAEENLIDGESIKTLTNQGLAKIKELEEENIQLRKQVAKTKNKQDYDSSEENIPTSDDLLDNTDERTRIAINEEAQQEIFTTLKSKGYLLPENISIIYTIVDGVVHPNGTRIKIVTKSAKGGTIYFNPSEWLALSEEDSQLFVVLSGNRVCNITLDDLILHNDKFHLRFNTQAFAVKANLKAFAELVKFLPETHFLFKAPISTSDFFKEFGLSERNPSSGDLSSDDKELLH